MRGIPNFGGNGPRRAGRPCLVGPLFSASLLLLASFVPPAAAQQCDCSRHIGQCSAHMTLRGQRLDFSASTRQCAQITYSVNGEPGSITIAGGRRLDRLSDHQPADAAAVGRLLLRLPDGGGGFRAAAPLSRLGLREELQRCCQAAARQLRCASAHAHLRGDGRLL
jgi:hypothetical protein